MTVQTDEELQKLRRIGKIVGMALQEMRRNVRPGIITAELDEIGAQILAMHGAKSAPIITYNFPGATCISINNVAAHGIPGDRVIRKGDMVNLDVSAERDGYFADAAVTVLVTPVSSIKEKLVKCTRLALKKGLGVARAGTRINEIGRTYESVAQRFGLNVIKDLPGHGIGRGLHEEPTIPGFYMRRMNQPLREGMVITLEPFISAGSQHVVELDDGWTLKTTDGSFCGQFEHTIVVTKGRPIILTAA